MLCRRITVDGAVPYFLPATRASIGWAVIEADVWCSTRAPVGHSPVAIAAVDNGFVVVFVIGKVKNARIHLNPHLAWIAFHGRAVAATALRADVAVQSGAACRALSRCEATDWKCGRTRSPLCAKSAGRMTYAVKAAVDGEFLLQSSHKTNVHCCLYGQGLSLTSSERMLSLAGPFRNSCGCMVGKRIRNSASPRTLRMASCVQVPWAL